MASETAISEPSRARAGIRARLLAERGLALLALAALFPLFANLGAGVLWADEADTAVFARTILSRGLPYAWDGTTFIESDAGRRLNDDLLMVGTPWLPYYVTAASLALFGESSTAARLPFALAGLATLLLLVLWVRRATGDRRAALLAGGLLLGSVPFLLYARQCRHYALNALLSVALLAAFPRLERRRMDPLFVALAVLLYHCHPLPAAAALLALGGLSVVHPAFRAARRGFALSLFPIAMLTLPWAFVARGGWDENTRRPGELFELVPRLQQFGYEALVALPVFGWLALAPFAWRRLDARDRAFVALGLALVAAYAALTPFVQSTLQLWEYGLRYTTALLPVGAALTGLMIARAARARLWPALAIAAVFACTHLPASAPLWWLVAETPPPLEPRASLHRPAPGVDRILRTELDAFVRELVGWTPGTEARIVAYLAKHARPGDRILTNYAWEPLYFHTRLPQTYKVLESHPSFAAARANGLPDYVFEPDAARFVIWRVPWEGYLGYRFDDVKTRLRAAGATLRPVASIPETTWENRESLHFRRFPGVGHLYPGVIEPSADARIFRVERTGDGSGTPQPGAERAREDPLTPTP